MAKPKLNEAYFPLVMEECGEVLQAIGKCQRFGIEHLWARQDNKPNYVVLAHEIGGLIEVMRRLDIDPNLIAEGIEKKKARLEIFGPEVWTPEKGDPVAKREAKFRHTEVLRKD